MTGLLYRCPACRAEVTLEDYGKWAPECEEHDPPRPMRRVRFARCAGSGLPRVDDACRACWQPVEADREGRAVEHHREVARP